MKKKSTRRSSSPIRMQSAASQSPGPAPAASQKSAQPGTAGSLTATLDDPIDMQQAIDLLKTTRTTFYRWLKSGTLKGMKIGRQWRFYRADIQRFLEGDAPRMELPTAIEPLLETLRAKIDSLWNPDCGLRREYVKPIQTAPIPLDDPGRVQLAAEWLITLGVIMHATDIHLGPRFDADTGSQIGTVRFQIDGVLQEIVTFDLRLLPNLIGWLKTRASCDVNLKARPQDGRILLKIDQTTLDLRICFVTVLYGESATLRVLWPSTISLSLEKLGIGPTDRARLAKALESRWGMIIVTGPTAAGKTTTLYAGVNHIAGPSRKIMSVEDPVEYMLPWIDQIQLDVKSGLTFPVAMRAMLRSAANALLVGEIRDKDTLLLCCQAALTGHLVLSTLHAPDTASALVRMVEIGIDPFVISDSTRLVMSQRLVRLLCPDCAEPETPDPQQLGMAQRWALEGGLNWQDFNPVFLKPVGCARCAFTGFRQRVAAAETLALTPAIGAALRRGAPIAELRRIAVDQGMTTMLADGLRRALTGETALSEIIQLAASLQ